jgi:hypothetical protein
MWSCTIWEQTCYKFAPVDSWISAGSPDIKFNSFWSFKLVKACITDLQKSTHTHTHTFTRKSPTFSTIFVSPLFRYLHPVLGGLLSTNGALLLLFWLSRKFSFQAQFLFTSFFFMVVRCLLDSFTVLFDWAEFSSSTYSWKNLRFVFHV